MIDRTILELSRSKKQAALSQTSRATPRRCCSSRSSATPSRRRAPKLDKLEQAWSSHGHGYHTLRAESQEQEALTKVRKAGPGC